MGFWKEELNATPFILGVVEHGYKIPFITAPPAFYAKNNTSSLDHPVFVEGAIDELLRNRCVVEVPHRPHCCNPLTVAQGKKLRLVLDLRHPNQFVAKIDFKYEDLAHIAQVLGAGQFYLFFFRFEVGLSPR